MNDIAVVISSWDKNSYMWDIVRYSYQKYWNNCPFPIYFITNNLDAPIGTTIKTGDNTDWVTMTKIALSKIPEKCIIWMLEDYWLWKHVNTPKIQEYCNFVVTGKADYIRLIPSEYAILNNEVSKDLGEYSLDATYKTSLGPSIWNKALMERLLKDGENIWQFELESAKRTKPTERFFAIKDWEDFVIVYLNGTYPQQVMVKGKLTASAFEYLRREGLKINATQTS